MNRVLRTIIGLTCLLLSPVILAYDEPQVNLGYTSFFDGGPPAGPGFYFQNYFQYYSSDKLVDRFGNKLPLPRTNVNVIADIIQGIYLSKIRLGKASLAVSAVLPSVLFVNVDDGLHNEVLSGHVGISDLFIGPALQFDPIMKNKRPLFVQRIELDLLVPTGYYNAKYAVNPGNHVWGLNPYWAATYWFTEKWSSSLRFHYLWNAKNNDPQASFGPSVNNIQAGQAVFANFASEYGFTEQLHIGVNGYFFNQITDTLVDGIGMPGRREQVWAVGPGMVYSFNKNQYVFFNIYFEQNARNRAQGTNSILRYVLHL